jgi:hypothetical protein
MVGVAVSISLFLNLKIRTRRGAGICQSRDMLHVTDGTDAASSVLEENEGLPALTHSAFCYIHSEIGQEVMSGVAFMDSRPCVIVER